ncbi:putative phospholipase carboxylesterase family protein [Rosellinia necatrix]|uniref:Putative phospholipase carboxylesterase family protein n=1 Tax=Rosellinia necatrix TaxID=77044 RepID=A0A1W2TWH7_ROSNE|nr:putative phospholipase carboxylesterase family protein [Rosellinia necatrix]
MMNIPCITTGPASGHSHTHTVVFLHGRGDNAQSFATGLDHWRDSRGRNLAAAFPTFRWVLPQAPVRRLASSPSQSWPQWFDTWNSRDFTQNEGLQAAGLREVVPVFRRMLADEAALLGDRRDRVVLAGISMGAATGAHLLFNLAEPIGAFMGFSGRCPFAGRSLAQMREVLQLDDVPEHSEVLRKTPVLLQHCVDDPLVSIQTGRGLRDTLRGFGCDVEWKEYPDGGHWFHSPTGMDDAVAFLEKHTMNNEDHAGGISSR